jgi:hypothetical protein
MSLKSGKQLDAWIAERLYGYRWFLFEVPEGRKWTTLELPAKWQARHGGKLVSGHVEGTERDLGSVKEYSTNPTAAMEVLESTVGVAGVELWQISGKWSIRTETPFYVNICAATLPLAICVFAKALWDEGERFSGKSTRNQPRNDSLDSSKTGAPKRS